MPVTSIVFFSNCIISYQGQILASKPPSIFVCRCFQIGQVLNFVIWQRVKISEVVELTLPNDNILQWSKLKAFVDDKMNVIQNLKFLLERIENTVGKRENAGYQHFLLFPQCFQKLSFSGSSKVGVV